MTLDLQLQNSEQLTAEEKANIESIIDKTITVHQSNSYEINKLVMDSVTCLTVSEARANELASQGFFKRLWKEASGKNQKIRADIDKNIVKSQYASQQLIQKLAEQNLMSFELITVVNNKLNFSLIEMDEKINRIYSTLILFFKQTKSDIIQLQNRVESLEKNVDLLHWNATIEYQMFEGVEYSSLNSTEKLICLVCDFYVKTHGVWDIRDLMLLKATFSEIGLPVKEVIKIKDFFESVINKPLLMNRIIEVVDTREITNLTANEVPLLYGVEKIRLLQNEEKCVAQTLVEQISKYNREYSLCDAQESLLHNYLKNNVEINIESEIITFDLAIELLWSIKNICNVEKIAEVSFEQQLISEGELLFYKGEFKKAYEYFNQNSTVNKPRDMYFFGVLLENGFGGILKDKELANELYKKGSDLGDPFCIYMRAETQIQVEKAAATALFIKTFNMLDQLGNKGDKEAQFILGEIFNNGVFVDKDYNKSITWYKKSVKQGYFRAQKVLGRMYLEEDGLREDAKEIFKLYRKLAEQGNMVSQYYLAKFYCQGFGVKKDEQETINWLKKSADQGYNDAQHDLGNIYYMGDNTKIDYKIAHHYFLLSAKQGNKITQRIIGDMYYFGDGVKIDFETALQWYKLSADNGDVHSLNIIGTMYFLGRGTEENFTKAFELFKSAAEQESGEAQFNLAKIYHQGFGDIDVDYFKAIEWYEKAMENCVGGAYNNLAYMYYRGEGIEKDYYEAKRLFEEAEACGDEYAKDNLEYNGEDVEMWKWNSFDPKYYSISENMF